MAKPGRPAAGLDDYLYWQERLTNRESSGLSIDDFCDAERISRSTFYRWVQRLKAGIPAAIQEEAAWLSPASTEATFLPITVTPSPVEIELPNGGVVRLPVSVGQGVIVEVIKAVTALRSRRQES